LTVSLSEKMTASPCQKESAFWLVVSSLPIANWHFAGAVVFPLVYCAFAHPLEGDFAGAGVFEPDGVLGLVVGERHVEA